jgi:hypothetical protein
VSPVAALRNGRRFRAAGIGARIGSELMEVVPMKHRTSSLFEQLDESSEPFWEVVVAWVMVILLFAATSVGLLLDHIATLSP